MGFAFFVFGETFLNYYGSIGRHSITELLGSSNFPFGFDIAPKQFGA